MFKQMEKKKLFSTKTYIEFVGFQNMRLSEMLEQLD